MAHLLKGDYIWTHRVCTLAVYFSFVALVETMTIWAILATSAYKLKISVHTWLVSDLGV